MRYVLFDLSSVRFGLSPEGTTLTARTSDRMLLGSIEIDRSASTAEQVFALLDMLLERGVLATRGDARVAFYNPYSGQVALGAVPRTEVFESDAALSVPAAGIDATLEEGRLVLASGEVLGQVEPDLAGLRSCLAAHPAAASRL